MRRAKLSDGARLRVVPWKLLLLTLCLAACGNASNAQDEAAGGAYVMFDVERASGDFFALPFPFDARRGRNGAIDVSGFPNPGNSHLLDKLLGQLERVNGFSLNGAVYMRLSAALDPTSLPATPAASLDPGSGVFLVCVDQASRDYGRRIPLHVRFLSGPGAYRPEDMLVALPVYGIGLREDTLYAMVVTVSVRDSSGKPLRVSDELRAVLFDPEAASRSERLAEARSVLAPLLQWLEESGVASVESLAGATVFRTRTVVPEMAAVSEYILGDYEVGSVWDIRDVTRYYYEKPAEAPVVLLAGRCRAPAFQTGMAPYLSGGRFVFDASGKPVLQRKEEIRFCLSLPKGAMPETGWPLVVYGHGTGGEYTSFVREDIDQRLGKVGIAVLSTDEPLQGARAHPVFNDPYWFYNFANPIAAVDNHRQSAADKIFLFRLARDLVIQAVRSPTGEEIRFDQEKMGYMGHSQGGITGALMLGVVPYIGVAVLSGTGGGFSMTLIEQTDEFKEVKDALGVLLGLSEDEELDSFHPIVTLLQTLADPADPLSYAAGYFRESCAGKPVNLFISEGTLDENTPPVTTEALASAAGAPQAIPVLREAEGLAIQGIAPVELTIRNNVSMECGPITAALVQYPDFHWPLFHHAYRQLQYSHFFGTYFATGVATLYSEEDACALEEGACPKP